MDAAAAKQREARNGWGPALRYLSVPSALIHCGRAIYHLRTLYLFVYSDFKTIIIPLSTFPVLLDPSAAPNLHKMLMFTFFNLLPFEISNQRSPSSIAEDSLNKPWRPLPSGRITPAVARYWMIALYVQAIAVSWGYLGAGKPSLALVALGSWYNSFGGADYNCIIRNLINALGYVSFLCGTMTAGGAIHSKSWSWLLIIACIIATSVHSQDLEDQEGDRERGRNTVPLVIGDRKARLIIITAVNFWSIFCPWWWKLSRAGYIVPVAMALAISWRLLMYKGTSSDKQSFRLWNLWTILGIYMLPLVKRFED